MHLSLATSWKLTVRHQPPVEELSKYLDAGLACETTHRVRRAIDLELETEDRVVRSSDSDVDRSWRLALLAPRPPDSRRRHDNIGAEKALGTKGHLTCRTLVDNGTRRHAE